MSNESGTFITSDDGTKIWAESAGDPSKPAVVLIHGLGCTALAFDKQFSDERLLKNLHMVRYEMRGHGRSGMPTSIEDYESIRYAQDFRVVCEAFKLKKPFVAGWSIGGVIPADVAAVHGTDYMSGVIYFGCIPWRSYHAEIATEWIMSMVPPLMSADLAPFNKTAIDFAESCVADPSAVPYATLMTWIAGLTVQPPIVRSHTILRTQDATRFLEEGPKTLPVLIIQGAEDRHIQAEVVVAGMKEKFDKVEAHIMKGVGHAPFYERPEESGDLILKFVNKYYTSGTA